VKRVRGNPVLIVWKGSCGSLLIGGCYGDVTTPIDNYWPVDNSQ